LRRCAIARFDKLELPEDEDPPPRRGAAATAAPAEKDAAHWLRLADEQRRAGSHESALRFYSRSLEVDRTAVNGWLGQVQIFPQHAEILAAGAQAKCRMGALPEALAMSDGALARPGESAYRWLVRGEIVLSQRERGDDHCFDKAAILDRDWLVPLEAATACLFHNAPAKALKRAQEAVERGPASPRCWFVQGECQQRLGMDSAAKKSFSRVLELSPQHIEARSRLAATGGGGMWRRLGRIFGGR
jgi:tetratricopeptide (TPR) repeat protein